MNGEKVGSNNMPTERTPLLQNVPVADQNERYPHRTIRRFCTIALISIPVVTLVAGLLYVFITGQDDVLVHVNSRVQLDIAAPNPSWPQTDGISYDRLQEILLETPDADRAREWSRYYASGAHLAGKNQSQAAWTKDRWSEWGLHKVEVVPYDTYLNYPLDHRLALLEDGKIKFEATLEEDVLDEDPTSGSDDRIPTFHGYSANGNVTAQYVFCNYGTYKDFQELQQANIDLEGKIALVKYGGVFRGLKVKRASELGMVGVIMYDDPGEDGNVTEKNGLKPYPDGPARNPTSVQRGSVEYLSIAPGDPTTIGYPSKPGVPRQSVKGKVPDIPSLPISYAEAIPLLQALNGHGPNATSFSQAWHTGGLDYKNVSYSIGPSPPSLTINLYNQVEYVTTPIWDTVGVINGSIKDEVIVIGNHRDAWILGGAGDPNSGSAALNEVVRAFGEALREGWKPLRTIVFASWDGEEYSLIGSTEWVEEFLPWLDQSAVAYVNVDVGTRGPHFQSNASPLLNQLLYETTASVPSPNQTVANQSVFDVWNKHIGTMGSGSDFTAFQDYAGIPSIDVGFGSSREDPVYHYHSNYDSSHWMETYGDPEFKYHVAMAKVLALMVASLSEKPIIPLNASDYAIALEKYVDSAKETAKHVWPGTTLEPLLELFKPLVNAVGRFHLAAAAFEADVTDLSNALKNTGDHPMNGNLVLGAHNANTKYKKLERQFLYMPGLDGRNWFKHVVFAPGIWTGYAGATFPCLIEALEAEDSALVQRWVGIIENTLDKAVRLLQGSSEYGLMAEE